MNNIINYNKNNYKIGALFFSVHILLLTFIHIWILKIAKKISPSLPSYTPNVMNNYLLF